MAEQHKCTCCCFLLHIRIRLWYKLMKGIGAWVQEESKHREEMWQSLSTGFSLGLSIFVFGPFQRESVCAHVLGNYYCGRKCICTLVTFQK